MNRIFDDLVDIELYAAVTKDLTKDEQALLNKVLKIIEDERLLEDRT